MVFVGIFEVQNVCFFEFSLKFRIFYFYEITILTYLQLNKIQKPKVYQYISGNFNILNVKFAVCIHKNIFYNWLLNERIFRNETESL